MAGEKLFRSGINIGTGLTYQLEQKINYKGHFIDTPGLEDQEMREKAGKAISEGLRKTGSYKVIFFVTEQNGRVIAQDATTMKLVLDAAPEIGDQYGVVINMVRNKIFKRIQNNPDEKQKFLDALFRSFSKEKTCRFEQVLFFPEIEELDEQNDVLISPKSVVSEKGIDLQAFVDRIVPVIENIRKENVKDIKTDKYVELKRQHDQMAAEMRKREEERRKQILAMDREKERMVEEMRRRELEMRKEKMEVYLVNDLCNKNIIKSTTVKNAMIQVDRACYIQQNPYMDRPQRLAFNTTISAPHMHAHALELLKDHLQPGMRALDVGCGSGYLTACMGLMVGNMGTVVGIDHIEGLVDLTKTNMIKDEKEDLLISGQLTLVVGDGRRGWADGAPYDAIHVGAASPTLPQYLVNQLANGGRMIIPVGPAGGNQTYVQVDKDHIGRVTKTNLFGVRYVPLTDKSEQLSNV